MDQNKPPKQYEPAIPGQDEHLARDPAVDDFLLRLTRNIRHPKPGQESIAAALQAIQRLALESDAELPAHATGARPLTCASCGAHNRAENRFCSSCGVPLVREPEAQEASPVQPGNSTTQQHLPPGDHHYYHHYHHHFFGDGAPANPEHEPRASAPSAAATTRSPLSGSALSRAELGVRKMIQDWAQACNTKHLDDLVSLYLNDAIVLRPNIPVVRGAAAIREMFFGVLDSGFGEVEFEPMRVEVFGELAYDAGRFKALVPIAMGKRREERGKYLVLCTRQNAEWKMIADCWSSDLSLADAPPLAPGKLPRKN